LIGVVEIDKHSQRVPTFFSPRKRFSKKKCIGLTWVKLTFHWAVLAPSQEDYVNLDFLCRFSSFVRGRNPYRKQIALHRNPGLGFDSEDAGCHWIIGARYPDR
jgi:hypothetical protein